MARGDVQITVMAPTELGPPTGMWIVRIISRAEAMRLYPERASELSNRFDYVRYDDVAGIKQATAKGYFVALDNWISTAIPDGRGKSLSLTKLEEAYMWIGKALRDDQIARNGSAELEEGRGNE